MDRSITDVGCLSSVLFGCSEVTMVVFLIFSDAINGPRLVLLFGNQRFTTEWILGQIAKSDLALRLQTQDDLQRSGFRSVEVNDFRWNGQCSMARSM